MFYFEYCFIFALWQFNPCLFFILLDKKKLRQFFLTVQNVVGSGRPTDQQVLNKKIFSRKLLRELNEMLKQICSIKFAFCGISIIKTQFSERYSFLDFEKTGEKSMDKFAFASPFIEVHKHCVIHIPRSRAFTRVQSLVKMNT